MATIKASALPVYAPPLTKNDFVLVCPASGGVFRSTMSNLIVALNDQGGITATGGGGGGTVGTVAGSSGALSATIATGGASDIKVGAIYRDGVDLYVGITETITATAIQKAYLVKLTNMVVAWQVELVPGSGANIEFLQLAKMDSFIFGGVAYDAGGQPKIAMIKFDPANGDALIFRRLNSIGSNSRQVTFFTFDLFYIAMAISFEDAGAEITYITTSVYTGITPSTRSTIQIKDGVTVLNSFIGDADGDSDNINEVFVTKTSGSHAVHVTYQTTSFNTIIGVSFKEATQFAGIMSVPLPKVSLSATKSDALMLCSLPTTSLVGTAELNLVSVIATTLVTNWQQHIKVTGAVGDYTPVGVVAVGTDIYIAFTVLVGGRTALFIVKMSVLGVLSFARMLSHPTSNVSAVDIRESAGGIFIAMDTALTGHVFEMNATGQFSALGGGIVAYESSDVVVTAGALTAGAYSYIENAGGVISHGTVASTTPVSTLSVT